MRKIMFRRVGILLGLALVTFCLFAFRLIQLQVVQGAEYLSLSETGSTRSLSVPAARGELVDRYGTALAVNRVRFDVVIDRSFISTDQLNDILYKTLYLLKQQGESVDFSLPILLAGDHYAFLSSDESAVTALKKHLGLNEYASADDAMSWLLDSYDIETEDRAVALELAAVRYEMELSDFSLTIPFTIAQDVSSATVARIEESSAQLPGVVIEETPVREYQDGTIAPHILGTTGPIYAEEYEELKNQGYRMDAIIGKDGIEAAAESYLKGTAGRKVIELDKYGSVTETYYASLPVPGNTVWLSIDESLQRVAQDALAERIERFHETGQVGNGRDATAGALVVVDVNTGEVLAAANYPSYDLSTYNTSYSELLAAENQPLYDRAFRGLYAPGSCFKPAVAIAALSEGLVDAETTVSCTGVYWVNGFKFTCTGAHGNVNLKRAITVSCNSYFYYIGSQLGAETINTYARQLGLGVSTGLEVPQSKGVLASAEEKDTWYLGDDVQAAIGQSVTLLSPIQLATYTAAIANGGTFYRNTLIHKITSYDGSETLYSHTPEVLGTIENKEAVELVRDAMRNVSLNGTTSSTFGSYAIETGTKTGTPQVATGSNNAVLIGFAPYENPEIAVAIVVEHGGGGYLLSGLMRTIFDAYFGL